MIKNIYYANTVNRTNIKTDLECISTLSMGSYIYLHDSLTTTSTKKIMNCFTRLQRLRNFFKKNLKAEFSLTIDILQKLSIDK